MNDDNRARADEHILFDLGFVTSYVGDEVHGSAPVVPEMAVAGTNVLRTSILATWADVVAGRLTMRVLAPRVPVTLDLDVHLYAPPRGCETIEVTARAIKSGRSVVVVGVQLASGDGTELGVGTVSFMAAPDPSMTMPAGMEADDGAPSRRGRLRVPFAERARCEVREAGVAVLQRSANGLNASNTVQGGLIALAVEEAALSLSPGSTLASMSLRYLRPVRVGPAVATAAVKAGLGTVEVCDEGSDGRLAVYAVTKAFDGAFHLGRQREGAAAADFVVPTVP